MSENVQWLRSSAAMWREQDGPDSIRAKHLDECADEIERLRTVLNTLAAAPGLELQEYEKQVQSTARNALER